jgi:hypothetical protein
METLDYLDAQEVSTALGHVAISAARHADGSVSVVAWLLPAGRRVGLLRGRARPRAIAAEALDPALAGTPLAALMRRRLASALAARPGDPAADPVPARAEAVGAADLRDLQGWQWRLAELAAARSLDERAADAACPAAPAGAAPAASARRRAAPPPGRC